MIGPPTNPAYRAKVVKQVGELGLQEHVTLLDGFSYGDSRLVDAYHSADCFVLPSLHEPFGMVVLEAWASGLAVVVSHVGGGSNVWWRMGITVFRWKLKSLRQTALPVV